MALSVGAIWALAAPAPASAGTCTGVSATLLQAGTKAPDGSTLSSPITDWEQISGQCSPAADTIRVTVPDCQPGCGGSNHRQIVEWWAHAPDPPGCTVSQTTNPNDTLTCPGKDDGRICIYIKKSPGPSAATAISAEPVHVVFPDTSTFDVTPSLGAATTGCGPGDHPENISPPFIFRSSNVGSLLFCDPGDWAGDEPLTPTFQWKRNGVPIPGATGNSYTSTQADVGADITCEVTMTNPEGDTATAESATFTIPPPLGGGAASAPPPGNALQLSPGKHPVNPKTGRAVIEFQLSEGDVLNQTFDLTEVLMFFIGGGAPRTLHASPSAAGTKAGTVADAHHSPGERTIRTTLKLNGKGKKALRAAGKLRVSIRGTLRNAAGSTPFSANLKLVAKGKK